jgi:hypothetical protein
MTGTLTDLSMTFSTVALPRLTGQFSLPDLRRQCSK